MIKLLENRYSLRDFSPKKIERCDLETILNAARLAPSAKNLQPCRVIAVETNEVLEKLRGVTKNAYNAPVVLVICVSREDSWERADGWRSHETDAAIVCDHMMITAASLGIGSVWACSFDKDKVREVLGIDGKFTPVSLLPIGYPSENAAPSERHTMRKDISEIVEYR